MRAGQSAAAWLAPLSIGSRARIVAPTPGRREHLEGPAEQLRALAHAVVPEAAAPVDPVVGVEAAAVVSDEDHERVPTRLHADVEPRRAGVADRVRGGLLDDAEGCRLKFGSEARGQVSSLQAHIEAAGLDVRVHVPPQRGGEAEIVKDGGPQLVDEFPEVVEAVLRQAV